MITTRKANERGGGHHGWLNTKHTFSFADYFDEQQIGFGALRVINEDVVAPARGFGLHGHRDMEIISYVLGGALKHHDSMGHGDTLKPGDVQVMSAGTGLMHSELNGSATEPVHFLQIWLVPDEDGGAPQYDQKFFAPETKQGRLALLASPSGPLTIRANAKVYATVLRKGDAPGLQLEAGRRAWVQVARGSVTVNGVALEQGDGAALVDEKQVMLSGEGEALVFDLA